MAGGSVEEGVSLAGLSAKYELVSSRSIAGCSCAAAPETKTNTIPKMAIARVIAYVPQRASWFFRP